MRASTVRASAASLLRARPRPSVRLFKTTILAKNIKGSHRLELYVDDVLDHHNIAVMDRRSEGSTSHSTGVGAYVSENRLSIITTSVLSLACKADLINVVACDTDVCDPSHTPPGPASLRLRQSIGRCLHWRTEMYAPIPHSRSSYARRVELSLTHRYLGPFYSMEKVRRKWEAARSVDNIIHYASSWQFKTDEAIALMRTITRGKVRSASLHDSRGRQFWCFGFGW